jgi:peroxiredoxin
MRLNRNTAARALVAAVTLCAASLALADELAIGAKGPNFKLLNVDGKTRSLADVAVGKDGKPAVATAVVFTCNHCPFAQAYEPVLLDIAKRYADKNIAFVFISSNDTTVVPDDSYEKMQERAKDKAYPFPYLFDASQATAKAYGASVTPHVFLLDRKHVLRYRGRVNDKKEQAEVTSNDLINALDAIVAGKPVDVAATKAFGCGIKWKKTS